MWPSVFISLAGWETWLIGTHAAVFLCCHPAYEGFPNVLLEAMANGCVCLASDCPHGPADLIQHGCNGVLLPRRARPDQWRDALADLLMDPNRCRGLADRALEVRNRYSEPQLRSCFVNALEQLLRGKRSAS